MIGDLIELLLTFVKAARLTTRPLDQDEYEEGIAYLVMALWEYDDKRKAFEATFGGDWLVYLSSLKEASKTKI